MCDSEKILIDHKTIVEYGTLPDVFDFYLTPYSAHFRVPISISRVEQSDHFYCNNHPPNDDLPRNDRRRLPLVRGRRVPGRRNHKKTF